MKPLVFLALTAALGLAGCQATPLYSTASPALNVKGDSVSAALSSIDVASPKTRLDQLMRNELQFALTGSTNREGTLPFTLTYQTKKNVRSIGIDDVDFGPRAFFVTIATDYVLKDGRKAAPIAQGTVEGTASYDRVDQEFANVRAERDAEKRAAETAAQRLKQALAIALKEAK